MTDISLIRGMEPRTDNRRHTKRLPLRCERNAEWGWRRLWQPRSLALGPVPFVLLPGDHSHLCPEKSWVLLLKCDVVCVALGPARSVLARLHLWDEGTHVEAPEPRLQAASGLQGTEGPAAVIWGCWLHDSFLPPVLEAEEELEGDGHPAGAMSASPSSPQTHTHTPGAGRARGSEEEEAAPWQVTITHP